MSVNHSDFLDSALALKLIENPTEMALRTAGSRAYYSLYHKTKNMLDEIGMVLMKVDKAGSHEGLIATVASLGMREKSFADAMSRLKRFRHNCDYDLEMTITEKRLSVQIAEAQRLVEMLDRIHLAVKK